LAESIEQISSAGSMADDLRREASRKVSQSSEERRKMTPSALHTNRTPMRFADRQATLQSRFRNSGFIKSVNRSGIPTGLSTSKAAPVSDILRIVQSIAAATPNMMEPPLKVRSR